MDVRQIHIQDFNYTLPDDRIARYPVPERDLSKLLIYKNGTISSDIYRNLPAHLPENSLLVFNNTRVIQARLLFNTERGAQVEIFCLEPSDAGCEINTAMLQTQSARWNCMIGRAGKWREKFLHFEKDGVKLSAQIVARNREVFMVGFSWFPEHFTFAEVLDKVGTVPIPPYLHRASEVSDNILYQTVYATQKGSVAAPTAGLHFTPQIFERLKAKNIQAVQVTLHVGAGTFKPVKSATIGEHEMHAEWIDVSIETVRQILKAKAAGSSPLVAVGTTSLRTVESLYWMGIKTKINPAILPEELNVGQWEPYGPAIQLTTLEALENLLDWMEKNKLDRVTGRTGILIAPGYQLRLIDGLITNFHQPGSTLLLLVAAITGSDWKEIYDYALSHDFRFLSYGDGSLLWAK